MSTIITKRQFPNYHKYTMELAGRPLTLEVGKLAELANAAVMVTYGETSVLCCVTASARPRDGIDFFPLSVDFEEKLYSVGRIPGSFNRREGRPGEKGILTSRVIDRPIRPLFPSDFRNDVSVMCTVMSMDHDCSAEIAALIGTSAALAISVISVTLGLNFITIGCFAFALMALVISYSALGSWPKAIPPSFTLGQDTLISSRSTGSSASRSTTST